MIATRVITHRHCHRLSEVFFRACAHRYPACIYIHIYVLYKRREKSNLSTTNIVFRPNRPYPPLVLVLRGKLVALSLSHTHAHIQSPYHSPCHFPSRSISSLPTLVYTNASPFRRRRRRSATGQKPAAWRKRDKLGVLFRAGQRTGCTSHARTHAPTRINIARPPARSRTLYTLFSRAHIIVRVRIPRIRTVIVPSAFYTQARTCSRG